MDGIVAPSVGGDPGVALARLAGGDGTRRARQCDQPSAWASRAPSARPWWDSVSRVPSPSRSSVTSTRVDPGSTNGSVPSKPQVKTTRLGGSTSTYSPITTSRPLASTRNVPPGRGSSSAATPIQLTIRVGSVKYGNTTSGGAAIRTSLRSGSVPSGIVPVGRVLVLGRGLEIAEGARPHRLDVRADLRQALGSRAVPAPRAVATLADQSCLEQDPQVLRDGLARDVEPSGDVACRPLVDREQREHVAAPGLGEHLEHVGHRAQVYTCAS